MMRLEKRIRDHLTFLYGAERGEHAWTLLSERLDAFRRHHPEKKSTPPGSALPLTEADAILITYGDQMQEPEEPPLHTLAVTLPMLIGDFITGVHILPFYPFSSDDGFSVTDYKAINPGWGSWDNIHRLGRHFLLMIDAVINHTSRRSGWFLRFLADIAPYNDYFLTVDPSADLSQVVRPRALPVLMPVETARGSEHVWTTFSDDQIDLNYANPQLVLAVIDVLLFYVEQSAGLIRLDAVAFLWKEIGTSCIHLPQTHRVIKLLRAVLDAVAPGVLLLSETKVPHEENVSYFGDGTDEAQLVYQFPLPPLTLHTLLTGDAGPLQRWAATLVTPSSRTTFFNILASHDGIDLRPVEGLLTRQQVDDLVARTEVHGGYVSYHSAPDGSQSPYELNIVYFDALNNPNADEPTHVQLDRFMVAQAILLSLAGVPGIYVHSLFGSRNWREGVEQTGHHRTINRQKFQRAQLEADLADPSTIRHQVFLRYRALIRARAGEPAFHPNAAQQVLPTPPALFCLVRTALDAGSRVLCIHNVTAEAQRFHAKLSDFGFQAATPLNDVTTGMNITLNHLAN